MDQEHEILVIGGGPAAITLAKNLGGKRDIALIRPEDHSMIYCAMPYAIEGILPLEKTLKSDSLVTGAGAALIRDRVTEVDFRKKVVRTRSDRRIGYGKLIIATGADPVIPDIPGHTLNGVMTFKTERDMRRILDLVEKGLSQAVIVGAGAIGIELAQALTARGVETHLADMADQILSNLSDREMVEEAQAELSRSGVVMRLGSKVEELRGEGSVREVIFSDGSSLRLPPPNGGDVPGGIVVFAVGVKPNVALFEGTELAVESGGILVNEKMETNVSDVYAAGDCTQFSSAITGEITGGKLATNAVPMGRVLAANLLGKKRVYRGFYNGSATKIGSFFIGGTGLTETAAKKKYTPVTSYSEFTTSFPIMPSAKKVKMKLIADRGSGKLIGGQVISGEPVTDKIDQLTMAIQWGIPVEELTGFSYSSQPYQSFFPAHNLIAKAAEELAAKL